MRKLSAIPISALLIGALAIATLPPVAAPVHAETANADTEDPAFSGAKLVDLAACALGIATIETGIGAVVAALSCSKAAITWWST